MWMIYTNRTNEWHFINSIIRGGTYHEEDWSQHVVSIWNRDFYHFLVHDPLRSINTTDLPDAPQGHCRSGRCPDDTVRGHWSHPPMEMIATPIIGVQVAGWLAALVKALCHWSLVGHQFHREHRFRSSMVAAQLKSIRKHKEIISLAIIISKNP